MVFPGALVLQVIEVELPERALEGEKADATDVAAHGEDHPVDSFRHLGHDLRTQVAIVHVRCLRCLAFGDACLLKIGSGPFICASYSI